MTVLVTGGAGYIGSHMVLRLLDEGENVVVIDNLVTGFREAVDARATFIECDAGNKAAVSEIISNYNVQEIMHFAGSVVVPESVENPLKYYENNTTVSRNLIDVAVKCGVKNIVFSSTAAVYGMTGLAPVVEETPLQPMSPYGRSKLMTEWMLSDVAAAHPITYGVLRYFNVAGADPEGRVGQSTANATHLIKATCQTALGLRDQINVFGTDFETRDGTGVRDYIHITDLIEAHYLLLAYLRRGGESTTLNCAYGKGYSVREVIEAVKKVSGSDFKVVEQGRRPGDPASVTATGQKLRDTLDWVPRWDNIDKIVEHAYAWEAKIQ